MTTALFFLSSTIFILLWIAFSRFEGYREAFLFFYRNFVPTIPDDKLRHKNLHGDFTWQRGLVVASYAIVLFINIPINFMTLLAVFVSAVSTMFVFPYYHDGQYHLTYNDLDPNTYKLRWEDVATSSNAKQNYTYKQRVRLLVVGFVLHFTATAIVYFS